MIRELSFEVRYGECDMMGVVNHTVYAVWCENARVDYLNALGFTFAELEALHIAPSLVVLDAQYLASVTYPACVTVQTHASAYSKKKIELSYEIFCDGHLAARLRTVTVWTQSGHSIDISALLPAAYDRLAAICL